MQVVANKSLWTFAHGTTVLLSFDVQNFVSKWGYIKPKLPSTLNYDGKTVGGIGPKHV